MNRKLDVIICPVCMREYLPAEIFIPTAFFGTPDLIKRDINGKVEHVSGTPSDTTELYCCDNCNTSFTVVSRVTFETTVDERTNLNTDYVSDMKARFKLKEF